jgi:vacuolar-type H+-ATPase subunit D/Vma8
MNPEVKKIGNKLFDKVELSSQKVELALIDDINKLLDGNLAKQRTLIAQGLKLSDDLLALTVDYQKALSLSIDAANKAKELGIPDAEKLFRVRGEEAKDFLNVVGKVSQQIDTALRSI